MTLTRSSRSPVLGFLVLLLALLLPEASMATNGLNLIASGGISSALAGADTAVATDYSAMNTNPAGLTQIQGTEIGSSLGAILPSIHFTNASGIKHDGENDPIVFGSGGYVRHLAGTDITLGVGFFSVGGLATDYQNLNTVFTPFTGVQDKRGSFIRHYKFTPSIAYQVTDKLSLGTALAVSYVDASITFFPNTAPPSALGFPVGTRGGFETTGKCNRANGIQLPASCAYTVAFIPKFGALYKLTDTITLGLAYTMKAPLPLDDGQLDQNLTGVGRVRYEAHLQGLKWPEDLAAGIAVRPRSDLLIAAKFQWINWNAAINTVTINLTNGSNPSFSNGSITLPFNWRDQYVVAIGAAYDVNDRLNIAGGYNYGNNPVPAGTMDPIIASIVEHHVVAASKYQFTEKLSLQGSFTYAFKHQVSFFPSATSLLPAGMSTVQVGGSDFLFTLIYRP